MANEAKLTVMARCNQQKMSSLGDVTAEHLQQVVQLANEYDLQTKQQAEF